MPVEATVLCVDGSDVSEQAVAAGLAVLERTPRMVVVTVIEPSDPTLLTGTGFAGGIGSPEDLHDLQQSRASIGRQMAERAGRRLGVDGAEVHVLHGQPGPELCALAAALPARVLVMGSRGRGGIKRALLGSVSDYVVRNAPCPVLITAPDR